MKDNLKVGAFTELTQSEAELLDGGSLFSDILDSVKAGIYTMVLPFPSIVGNSVTAIADIVINAIEVIASPIYSLVGWSFRNK